MQNTKQIGNMGEEIASRYLIKKGYKIIERNYYAGKGEIDIIAQDEECLVFVEVKYRTTSYMDYGYQAVNKHKQRRIINAAKMYLYKNDLSFDREIRFDVIDIFENEITHFKAAFVEG